MPPKRKKNISSNPTDEEKPEREAESSPSPPLSRKENTTPAQNPNNNNNQSNPTKEIIKQTKKPKKEEEEKQNLTPEYLSTYTVRELKVLCQIYCLPVSGTKQTLIHRLAQAPPLKAPPTNPGEIVHKPKKCRGWERDGWYCGTRAGEVFPGTWEGSSGNATDIHYGGFDYDCIQCGQGWLQRGWFCGCLWVSHEELKDQVLTRRKHGLAEAPKEFVQEFNRVYGNVDVNEEGGQGEEEEEDVERGEDKPECPYGIKCYRKNPAHFQQFQHTGKKLKVEKD